MILDIKLFLYSVVIKGLLLVKAPGNADLRCTDVLKLLLLL